MRLSSLRLCAPLVAVLGFACSGDEPDTGLTPQITSFTATPSEVAAGETAELEWVVTNATTIRIVDAAGTEVTTSMAGTGKVSTPAITANTTFTLEATNDAGTNTQSVTVTVASSGDAVIVSLTATPNPVDYLADTTVSWEVTGATKVTVSVNGSERLADADLMGTLAVTADELGFMLVRVAATGANGTEVGQNLQIDVIAPPGVESEPNDSPAEATELDDQGRATASLSTDTDLDFFAITVPEGGWVRAETSDGNGGCTVDQDMALVDDTGAILAVAGFGEFVLDANGQAVGACRRLDPRVAAGARNLAAGTYYLQVQSGQFQPPTGDYEILVETGMPACGNGIIETNETCDDGNTSGGDSCPATCDAGPVATVSVADGAPNLIEQSLTPLGSFTVQIDVAATSEMSILTGTGIIGQCDEQILVTLMDGAGAIVAQSAGFQISQQQFWPCGRLDPDATADAFPLAAGTYMVRVEALDPEASVDEVDVLVRLYDGAGCGNGYQDGDELCDDGNTVDDDRCANDCSLNTLPFGSTIDPVEVGTTFDNFRRMRIQVQETGIVSATVGPASTSTSTDCGMDTLMAILTPEAQFDVIGVAAGGRCAGIDPSGDAFAVNLEAGTYDFAVLNSGDGIGGNVSVSTASVAPGCGNGVPEAAANEACDDGNTDDNDFCRNDCTLNPAFGEMEPNNDRNTATVIPVMQGTPAVRIGSIGADGDEVDTWAVSIPNNADWGIWTYTNLGDRDSCVGRDTMLSVLDSSGNALIARDDRPNGNLCSALDSADVPELQGLTGGTYYIVVERYMGSTPGNYFIDVEIR